MDISEALAADLALLTEALDEPGIGIADTVRQLAADVGMAVPSFLGLTVRPAVATYRSTSPCWPATARTATCAPR